MGVLWVLYLLNQGFPLYGGAVLSAAMLGQIPMARATYGLGFTLFNLFAGVPAVVVAGVIHRWGTRRTFVLGSVLTSLGALWMALVARTAAHFLFGFGVLIATGVGFSTVLPLASTLARWFTVYRGRAMACALTASGIGGLLAAPLLQRLMEAPQGSWRTGWSLIAALSLLAAALAWFAVKESPAELGQLPDGRPAAPQANPAPMPVWTARRAARTRAFWALCLGSLACQFPFFLFTAHWILHLRGRGVDPTTAALAMGAFTLGSIPGGLAGGWLADRLSPRRAFQLGLSLYLLGSLLAVQAGPGHLSLTFAAALLYGAGFRWSFVALSAAVAHQYGPASFPRLSGAILMCSALVCSPAGFLGGRIFDRFGSYTPAFALNAGVALLGIAALSLASSQKPEARS